MSLNCDIGKSIVATLPRDEAEALCQYLNYHCVDAILCRCAQDDMCALAVDDSCREKASRLIADYRQTHDKSARKHPPVITVITEKISDLTSSGLLFIICGAIVFLISALRLMRVVGFRSLFLAETDPLSRVLLIIELLLGAVFLFFGIRLLIKAGKARTCRNSESAYTLHVITWFLGTYSPEDLDKLCENDEDGAAPGEARRRQIRRCIRREFGVEDRDYLDYLVEETYASLYHTRKFGD